jgi:tRNA/rRNA methyltransferase
MNLLHGVQFLLVEPSEGGNVGACCRAMKNCGFTPGSLTLVDPRVEDWVQARKMAVHAADLLDEAQRFEQLEDALAEAQWVVGVSGRPRTHPERKVPIEPHEFIERLRAQSDRGQTALVFGCERTGLTNAQLGRCQDVLTLPTSRAYSSLNLAQAVMVVAWTLRLAQLESLTPAADPEPSDGLATAAELEGLVGHAERTLMLIEYLDPQNPRLILDELRKVFARAGLSPRELSMLRGIFHRMDVWISEHGGPPTANQLNRIRASKQADKGDRS